MSRYLLGLAEDHASRIQEVAAFASISMLQDSLEAFLVAAADHLNAQVSPRTDFSSYLDKINEKLPDGVELPFRRRLIEINKVRVLAKHDGARPDATELIGYVSDARAFFQEASQTIFQASYWGIDLISLLKDGEIKEIMQNAKDFLVNEEYSDCLIECRKAIYLCFEQNYDIQKFKGGEIKNFLLGFSSAPYFARNPKYIEENVKEPFDYIVLDHSHIDADLMKMGIDHVGFWNVWRLTPRVYRHKQKDEWMILNEPKQFEGDDLNQRATYVFDTTVGIILKRQQNQESLKWVRSDTSFFVKVRGGAPLYRKAIADSDIVDHVPDHFERLDVSHGTPALSGKGFFWRVFHIIPGDEESTGDMISGYLSSDDTID